MSGWKLARRITLTVVVVVFGVPLLVLGAALAGLEPTHWSGARLSGVEVLSLFHRPVAAPEPATVLLSQARDQDDRDDGDLAPSYWDPDAGLVVLGAVTPAGVQLLDTLGRSSGTRYEVRRRATSSRDLRQGMDDLTFGNVEGRATTLELLLGPSGEVRPDPPSQWSLADPPGTWFTLLTGFPWYLGGVLGVLTVWWALAVRAHLRRRSPAA